MSRNVPFKTGYERGRRVITDILETHGLRGNGVEIGVKRGEFSKHLLQHWNCEKLYLVDPWISQDPSTYDETHHDHDDDFSKCLANVSPFAGKFEIVKDFSYNAADRFADNFFDFVYIDGNHSYDAVKTDLRMWYPKLKAGGLIAGDDYTQLPEETVFDYNFGVKRAVDEFARTHRKNVSIDLVGDWYYPTGIETSTHDMLVCPSRNWYLFK